MSARFMPWQPDAAAIILGLDIFIASRMAYHGEDDQQARLSWLLLTAEEKDSFISEAATVLRFHRPARKPLIVSSLRGTVEGCENLIGEIDPRD